MDVLGSIGVETFKILAAILATVVGLALLAGFGRRWQWAVCGAGCTYMVATASIGVYVLMTIGDVRWSTGKEPLLQAPSFSGTPVIGRSLEPLDSFLGQAATSINEFVAFRHAFPVAQDFFTLAGWTFLLLIPVTIIAMIVTRFQPSREQLEIRALREEIRQIKRHVDMS